MAAGSAEGGTAEPSAGPGRVGEATKYGDSVLLPRTNFPMIVSGQELVERELEIQRLCGFSELYAWQRARKAKKEFCLHDGPPYANGDPHVGHALNKVPADVARRPILKDIRNRFEVLRGRHVHYVPGWDCHGLPIELKALGDPAGTKDLTPLQIRRKAREFAEGAVARQRAAFRRWGVVADWDECYRTSEGRYEAGELRVFREMHAKGFVYRDYKPVFWSPSTRTALAEAELEYNPRHVSRAVYVTFPLTTPPAKLASSAVNWGSVAVLVWTTQPWSIQVNQAICFMPNTQYSLVRRADSSQLLLVATECIETLAAKLGAQLDPVGTFAGSELEGGVCQHPTVPGKTLPLLPGNHVTVGKGTGLVHVAPAHGMEDFGVATHFKLPVEEDFVHSYPYDWRSKQPVIIRASKQWFINVDSLKDKAKEALQKVRVTPESARGGLMAMLDQRTYWCISRQRSWGVPIPVFYHRETDEPLLNRHTVSHVAQLFAEKGSDCWWELPLDSLLPPEVLKKSKAGAANDYVRGEDVLDIWFDSGVSWAAVLPEADPRADVYVEGRDQLGGWFQSSLLTSIAVRNKAPYRRSLPAGRSLLVHGFTVTETGDKMSKSVGNVVDPDTIINGGEDPSVSPPYGADVLRWWVAESNIFSEVQIGPKALNSAQENINKLRNKLRFMLGNLHDFDPRSHTVDPKDTHYIDQYLLHLLRDFSIKVTDAYSEFDAGRVIRLLQAFITRDLSSFYFTIIKDRLYCDAADSLGRRSCQTVLWEILDGVTRAVAPIVPHLAEDLYLHTPGHDGIPNGRTSRVEGKVGPFGLSCRQGETLFRSGWMKSSSMWKKPGLEEAVEGACAIRDSFLSVVSAHKAPEYELTIAIEPGLLFELMEEEPTSTCSQLTELMMSSRTTLLSSMPRDLPHDALVTSGSFLINLEGGVIREESAYSLAATPCSMSRCPRCRRYTAESLDCLCPRCQTVLAGTK
ncbi:isoleucine--tRNA ligase, mitochondrial-like [Scleropages formosus]|uniref:Isoleucine--tRNA ligase, mitochondrial n=1 Tax=Scleropages formosus TaxID=113540 RepID=A0A0P7VVF0_SCLFO|nr:isoleucine--tRNA ligase, mitochondrial-like [Scleropages formosus]